MKKVRECENISPKSSKMFRIFVFLFQNAQKGPKTLNSAILIITARLRILKVMFLYILTIRTENAKFCYTHHYRTPKNTKSYVPLYSYHTIRMTTPALQSFSRKKLANAAYGAFMQAFEKLILKATTEKLGLDTGAFTAFQTKLIQFVDSNRTAGQQDLTKRLNDLDYRRDQLLIYCFAKINLEASSPKEAIRKAAEALVPLRKQYFGLQSNPQREESFLINGLLLDAEKEPYKAAITTLGLKEALEELKKVNADFETQLSQRAEAQLAESPLSAKQLRAELDEFYDTATRRVDAFNLLTPTAES